MGRLQIFQGAPLKNKCAYKYLKWWAQAPQSAAIRELAEETGYRAGTMKPLCEFFMSPGVFPERMYLFLATDLKPGPPNLEPGEQITSRVTAWQEALAMTRDGRIEDAKTLIGLLFYDNLRTKCA